MSEGYHALTEKEKQTLRLIVRGHDAKSTARQLGLSVHTVNERLRDARRKLSVSSSREAARLVLAAEGIPSPFPPDLVTDKSLGDAEPAADMTAKASRAPQLRWAWTAGGVLIMSLILAMLALNSLSQTPPPAGPVQAAHVGAAEAADATRSARSWLALVDQGRWDESWNASGQQFRRLNTSKTWAAISEAVRPPLGAVVSRSAISQERVPAPPHGYLIVKFRTSFAGKPEAVETVSLEREAAGWKVVGYWIA